MISRAEAGEIALAHVREALQQGEPDRVADARAPEPEPAIVAVQNSMEIGRQPAIYGLSLPLESCWIAYLAPRSHMLASSRIVLVSQETGEVVYFGSAHDEG